MSKSVLSLHKIAHQMWCDYPFSQRKRTAERTVGVRVEGDRVVGGGGGEGGVGQNLKKE